MAEPASKPRGDLAIRTVAMPADTNPSGDIFGGWVLSQMDIAGGVTANSLAEGRVATVAVNAMTFHLPVYVGDVLCVYTEVEKRGRTSISINVEAWALRRGGSERVRVTEGLFVFVAIDDSGKPRALPRASMEV